MPPNLPLLRDFDIIIYLAQRALNFRRSFCVFMKSGECVKVWVYKRAHLPPYIPTTSHTNFSIFIIPFFYIGKNEKWKNEHISKSSTYKNRINIY